MPIIPAFKTLRLKDHEFEASLGKTCLKKNKNKKQKTKQKHQI
jgi:hypothetical protein